MNSCTSVGTALKNEMYSFAPAVSINIFERNSNAKINPPATAIINETTAINNDKGMYGINLGITSKKYNGSITMVITTFKNYRIF